MKDRFKQFWTAYQQVHGPQPVEVRDFAYAFFAARDSKIGLPQWAHLAPKLDLKKGGAT